MPLVKNSSYRAWGIFRIGHANTIFPALFRKVDGLAYVRERITTPDHDFLDLDWVKTGSKRLLIALHGLEGNADRAYIKGMIKFFSRQGWDGLAMNFRGCSGESNQLLRSYHMGETKDIDLIIHHAIREMNYDEIVLVGFSLGGNVVLKYIGEWGKELNPRIKKAVVFSVPCEIPTANIEIAKWENRLYLWRFLKTLGEKVQMKKEWFPDEVADYHPIPKSFKEFDDRYTAPIHGFRDAMHYWTSSSSILFIPTIQIPVLMVNAWDDSFLSQECYPTELAASHPYFYLEVSKWGGHVGFSSFNHNGVYWSEKRALQFVNEK